jgi:vitamin B12 transporter
MKTSLRRTAGLLAFIAPLSAFAQINRLDQVVVTASRTPQRLGDVLADVTVIDRAEIERQFTGSVADLLVASGCAEISQNGGPTATTSLFLRGADTRHTVVLVDGVRVDSQSTGGATWQAIPLAQIERVEVLKGPASSVYGSDAVAGVVQIFTRKAGSHPVVEVGAAVGNMGSFKADGLVSGGDRNFDYALSAAGERSKGYDVTTPDNPYSYIANRDDGWRSGSGSLRLGSSFAAGQRIEFIGLTSHANTQYNGSSFTPQADDHAIQDNRVAQLSWSADWNAALHTQLSAGQSSDRYATESFNNPSPFPYLTETRLRNLALLGSYKLDSANQLNFQLERREDRLQNSDLATGQDTRGNTGAALGWLYTLGALDLQLHGRHDHDSQYGSVNTGTVAAGYDLGSGWRAYASAGNAFRAPTLYQRGSVYGPKLSLPGVTPLAPERGHNREIGLRWDGQSMGVSASAYHNLVSDLIIFGNPGSCVSTYGCYQNVASARLQGVSLAANAQWGVTRLSGTLDFQQPIDAGTGNLLPRRARQFGTLRAETTLSGWDLGANAQVNGHRYDDTANTTPLGGYALLNLDAQYHLNPEWKLQFKLDNALQRSYTQAFGYASMPRQFYVGLRYAPKF